jgi:hypothetical protein
MLIESVMCDNIESNINIMACTAGNLVLAFTFTFTFQETVLEAQQLCIININNRKRSCRM